MHQQQQQQLQLHCQGCSAVARQVTSSAQQQQQWRQSQARVRGCETSGCLERLHPCLLLPCPLQD
jgi:hypothetical protein